MRLPLSTSSFRPARGLWCGLVVAVGMAGAAGSVRAQSASSSNESLLGSETSVGYGGLPSSAPRGSESGVSLSENAVLHAGVGVEAGYDSNVFYSEDAKSAPIVRVLPFLQLTNAGRGGKAPRSVRADLTAHLQYRDYMSDDAEVKRQRAFMPTLSGTVDINSSQTFSLMVFDTFTRSEEPPYLPGDEPIVHDANFGGIDVRFGPSGRRFRFVLGYSNLLNYYENDTYSDSSYMHHTFKLDASWRWFPKTAVFVNVSQGIVTYLNRDSGGSLPLRAVAGLRGLFTPKLAMQLAVGYMNGFYDGVNTSGVLGSMAGNIEILYRPTLTTRFTIGYRHDFQNTIVANFYYLDTAYVVLRQQIAGRLSLAASAKYEHRTFQGLAATMGASTSRTDDFVQAGLQADYNIKDWFYFGAGYAMYVNGSDYSYMDPVSGTAQTLDYAKHQVFARLGFTY